MWGQRQEANIIASAFYAYIKIHYLISIDTIMLLCISSTNFLECSATGERNTFLSVIMCRLRSLSKSLQS